MTDYRREIRALAETPTIARALQAIDDDFDRAIRDWGDLVQIPAPSGDEEARAEAVGRLLTEAGVGEQRRDEAGNVIARIPGTEPDAASIVLDAHLDTVWGHGTNLTPKIEGGRLAAPGAIDNTVALAGMVAISRAIIASGVTLGRSLILAATTEEEVGVRGGRVLAEALRGLPLKAYIYLHGGGMRVTYGRTMGVRWYRIRFEGPGGHTQFDHATQSATVPVCIAVSRLYSEVELVTEPQLEQRLFNVGMLSGGDVVNGKAAVASFSLDLRSFSEERLDATELQIRGITEEVATTTGFRCEWQQVSGHPASFDPDARTSERVAWSVAASEYLGIDVDLVERLGGGTAWASAAGLPVMGHHITTGEGFHSPGEYGDIEPLRQGLKRLFLVVAALAGGS